MRYFCDVTQIFLRYVTPRYVKILPLWSQWSRYPDRPDTETPEIKNMPKTKNQYRVWKVWNGELKNVYKTSLASLEAEKKPLCYFWQLFNPRCLGIRTRVKNVGDMLEIARADAKIKSNWTVPTNTRDVLWI